MARITWKQDVVISIKLKDDLFVLAQMLKSPYMAFLNAFSKTDSWSEIDLEQVSILYIKGVTKHFLKNSEIKKENAVTPKSNLDLPKFWLQQGAGSNEKTIWHGTPDEMNIMYIGEEGCRIIENDISKAGSQKIDYSAEYFKDGKCKEVDMYELSCLGVYPETNERLILCHLFDKNVDPLKDLIFDRDLPLEYKPYFEAISG